MKSKVTEKFLKYIKVDTRSDENSSTFPSTEKQKNLGRILYEEMKELGVSDVYFDEEFGYVYGKIPANDGGISPKTIAFIAHMDTAPDISGEVLNDAGEVLTSYPAKTPVAVDLDGDGKVEQVQVWFEGDNNYPTIQIDEIVFGEENWQQVHPYFKS